MKMNNSEEGIRERLIIAGIREIEEHGLNDLSLRRVASMCDVSCAAPYRHYRNKEELVLSIISYINTRWDMMASQIERIYEGNTAAQLIEVCVGIVRFLIANPNYLSVMLPVKGGMSNEQQREREKLWSRIDRLSAALSAERGLCVKGAEEKEFLLKTLIYGTVILLEDLEPSKCEENIGFMRNELERLIRLE